MNDKMKTALDATLRSGEKVLWESGVKPFGIFEGREGRGILLRWLICGVAIGGLAGGYLARGGRSVGFCVVALAALAVIVAAPILSYRQTVGQRYLLTDRRALTLRPDGTVFAMDRSGVGEARQYDVDCGGVAIALGSLLLAERDTQLRWRANHPLEGSDYQLRGVVFYRPEDPEGAMRLLHGEAA